MSVVEGTLLEARDVSNLVENEDSDESMQSMNERNAIFGAEPIAKDFKPELSETLLLYQSEMVDSNGVPIVDLSQSFMIHDEDDTIVFSSENSQNTEDQMKSESHVDEAFIVEEDGKEPGKKEEIDMKNVNTVLIQNVEGASICVNGQMVELLDGSTAFVEDSKSENEVYTPIKLYNGNVIYVVAGTLLSSLSNSENVSVSYVTNPSDEGEAVTDMKQEKSKGFQCNYKNCTKSYTSFHHLKVHVRVHTGDRPFRCAFEGCSKAFSTGFGLKTHSRTHNGERPYVCTQGSCEKSFKTSGDLQKHTRTHTGERPFVCPIPDCGRSFTTCNICKVHVRTHTGERPYKCTYPNCGKTFASVTNQRNHIRIHSGEKPYVCSVEQCGRRFTEYSSLYKHNMVHRQHPHACGACGKTYRQASGLALHCKAVHSQGAQPEGEGPALLMLSGPDPGGECPMAEMFLVDTIKLEGGALEPDTLFSDLRDGPALSV